MLCATSPALRGGRAHSLTHSLTHSFGHCASWLIWRNPKPIGYFSPSGSSSRIPTQEAPHGQISVQGGSPKTNLLPMRLPTSGFAAHEPPHKAFRRQISGQRGFPLADFRPGRFPHIGFRPEASRITKRKDPHKQIRSPGRLPTSRIAPQEAPHK